MNSHEGEVQHPILRRATEADFDDIYNIWMQNHIIPFMTFERLSKNEFKEIFDTLMLGSEIYVIEDQGHVVATRRIIYGSGDHAHSVEFASFGVDKDHLNKGYGKHFYEFLVNKLRENNLERVKQGLPEIKRIEIGQETDNEIAFNLAKKMGFEAEVILPDWIRRKNRSRKIY